jgi:CheY-like chemotaxis protein
MKVIKILLVDDDQADAKDIKTTLDKINLVYKLEIAKNGEQGLEMLRLKTKNPEALPDLVLVDLNMPQMNGLEFLSAIRNCNEWKHLKCFVLTSPEKKLEHEQAKSLGISGCIVKPFKINSFSSIDSFNLMIDLINMKD